MSQTVLHVGLDKTGTTSIQYALDALRQDLRAEHLIYPVSPEMGHHHMDFARQFGFSWGVPLPTSAIKTRGTAYLRQCPDREHGLILSSEHFSYIATTQSIADLKAWIDTFRPDTDLKIVIYLRNQIDWFLSIYAEFIKWGGRFDITEFYAASRYRMDFAEQLQLWSDVFGRECLRVIDYDAHRRNALEPLLRVTNVSPGISQKARAIDIPFENHTLPHALLEVARTTDFVTTGDRFYSFVINRIYNAGHYQTYDLRSRWTWTIPEEMLADLDSLQFSNLSLCDEFGLTNSKLAILGEVLETSRARNAEIPEAAAILARARLLADEAEFFANA
jgi:hypothetical protein